MDHNEYKSAVYQTTMDLVEIDLIRLASGNISTRLPDGMVAITPSGVLYSQLKPEDIVIMDQEGQRVDGNYQPSSEWQLHTEIYKALPEVGAVVHVHSRCAIALGVVGLEIPVCNIEILQVGGPIPIAPFTTPGTREVGLGAAGILKERPGLSSLLLQNHGMVAVGKDLQDAYRSAYTTETGAEIYRLALSTGQEVQALSGEEIAEIWRVYQQPKAANP
jgi:ribulose-5-phosphate 4-epimerase/fuculose-1-phosphate aldolase